MVARRLAFLTLLLTLIAPPQSARADPAEDNELLRSAGIVADSPALVAWFRAFAPSGALPKVKDLVAQLGADEFADREAAVKQLLALGARAAPYLRPALRDRDRELAIRAEHCLKIIDAGPGPEVHAAALRMLAHLKPAGAAAALLDYLAFTPHESLADEAMTVLYAVAKTDDKIDPALGKALTDDNAVKRRAAAEALCQVGTAHEIAAVKKLLTDDDAGVRLRVGLALARKRDKDAIPVLIDLLGRLPAAQQGQIEGVLFRLAAEKAPRTSNRVNWAVWWQENQSSADLARLSDTTALLGFTLIAAAAEGVVQEIGPDGKIRWQIDKLRYPLSVQALGHDRVLIAEYRGNLVSERSSKGEILWRHEVAQPISAQRMPGGNTFIATRTRLFEIDAKGKLVFEQSLKGQVLAAAKKHPSGQIFYLTTARSFVRLDPSGKEQLAYPVNFGVNFGCAFDVALDGRVFIPISGRDRVVAYNAEGKVIKEYKVKAPDAVAVLPNGRLLVASQKERRVVELDEQGEIAWQQRTEIGPLRAWRR